MCSFSANVQKAFVFVPVGAGPPQRLFFSVPSPVCSIPPSPLPSSLVSSTLPFKNSQKFIRCQPLSLSLPKRIMFPLRTGAFTRLECQNCASQLWNGATSITSDISSEMAATVSPVRLRSPSVFFHHLQMCHVEGRLHVKATHKHRLVFVHPRRHLSSCHSQ